MNRLTLTIVAALVAMWLVGTLVAYTTAEAEVDRHASTFNYDANGLRALYEALQASGVPVQRWQRPYDELPDDAGVLVIAQPTVPMNEHEWQSRVKPWIEQGRTLVLASGMGNPDAPSFYAESALIDDLQYAWKPDGIPEFTEADDALDGQATSDEETPEEEAQPSPIAEFEELWERAQRVRDERAPSPPQWDTPFTPAEWRIDVEGFIPVYVHRPHATPLYTSEYGPYAWYIRLGKGHVVLTATARWLSNAEVANPHNLEIFLRTISLGGGRPVLFDERVQGYATGDITMADVWAQPAWGVALGQLLLLGGWLIATNAKRFGRPVPVTRDRSRSTLEYVDAMATLYRRARLRKPALRAQWKSFRVAVAKRYGIAPNAAAKTLEQRLREVVGAEPTDGIGDDLSVVTAALGAPRLTDREFVRAAKRLQRLREEVL